MLPSRYAELHQFDVPGHLMPFLGDDHLLLSIQVSIRSGWGLKDDGLSIQNIFVAIAQGNE